MNIPEALDKIDARFDQFENKMDTQFDALLVRFDRFENKTDTQFDRLILLWRIVTILMIIGHTAVAITLLNMN